MSTVKMTASVDGSSYILKQNVDGIYNKNLSAPNSDSAVDITAIDEAGNIMRETAVVYVDNIWMEPKIDWQEDDYFNIEDYNRIKNNITHLYNKALLLYLDFDILPMGEDKRHEEWYYAEEFNMFESNLETINGHIFSREIGEMVHFYDNGPFIAYDELNRIESAMLCIYEMLDRQKKNKCRLSFRLGKLKEVKT